MRGLTVWMVLPLACCAAAIAQQAGTFQRGIDAFNGGRYEEAAHWFAWAEAENPHASDALLREGKALIKLERMAQREDVLRQYAGEHKESADALYLLGLVLFREEKAKESLTTYTEAARRRKPTANELVAVSFDYVLLNDCPAAIHWLEVALGMDAKNYEACGRAHDGVALPESCQVPARETSRCRGRVGVEARHQGGRGLRRVPREAGAGAGGNM